MGVSLSGDLPPALTSSHFKHQIEIELKTENRKQCADDGMNPVGALSDRNFVKTPGAQNKTTDKKAHVEAPTNKNL